MSDYMKEAERLLDEYQLQVSAVSESRDAKAWLEHRTATHLALQARAALLAHIQRGAVPECDDGKRVLREVFALCEDTEVKCSEEPGDFARGRRFEAKGIARAIGAWYQEEFCGRTHMGEPAADAPTPTEVPMPEPIGFIDSNDDETWATLTQNAHELATLKLRSTVFHVSQMRTYGERCRAAGEAAGYARGLKEAGRDAVPVVQNGEVLVTVAGLTGSGKSAIAGEIEIMCRALGLDAEWVGGAAEKHLTHADWTEALEMYRPRVRIVEANIPRTDAALRGEVK